MIINCEQNKYVTKADEALESKIDEDFDIIKEDIVKARLKGII